MVRAWEAIIVACQWLILHNQCTRVTGETVACQSCVVCCQYCKASTVKRRRSEPHVPCPRWSSFVERCTVACDSVAASCAITGTSAVSLTSQCTWTSSAPVEERVASAFRTRCSIAPIRVRKTSRRTYSSATTAWQVLVVKTINTISNPCITTCLLSSLSGKSQRT